MNIKQHVLNLFCCCLLRNYFKKKNHLLKIGYIVDKPIDYSPSKYGYIKTHGWYDVGSYYKYGCYFILNEKNKYEFYNY